MGPNGFLIFNIVKNSRKVGGVGHQTTIILSRDEDGEEENGANHPEPGDEPPRKRGRT